jgi:uracil-DNA glycosylase
MFTDVKDSYKDIALPYVTMPNTDRKILFVLDYVPTDDLKSKKLLKGTTGEVLDMLEDIAVSEYLKRHKVEKFSWLACSYNAFRTAGKPVEFQQGASKEFAERIHALIIKYKPDTVVIFGDYATKAILPKFAALTDGAIGPWHGTPMKSTASYGGDSHKCTFFCNISLNPIVSNSSAYPVIGYMARRFASALYGSNPYAIDSKRIDKHRSILIDTLPKFNKLLDLLMEQPIVAIDTETTNLAKVTNKLLTIQFAKCMDFGYLIPIYHKDTPFTSKELVFICNRLKSFFEGSNKNVYHVYTNPLFDLNVIRTALKCRYMANAVWCIFSGEYAIDENQKFLENVTGDYYYSLGNLAVQFGYTGYRTAEFGKKNRGSMATVDLNAPGFIQYCLSGDNHVLLDTGFKPISEVSTGDIVMSYNHTTLQVEPQPVISVSSHTTSERMFEIEYEGGTLKVTENHEVWSVTRCSYVKVKNLQEGEEILPAGCA